MRIEFAPLTSKTQEYPGQHKPWKPIEAQVAVVRVSALAELCEQEPDLTLRDLAERLEVKDED